MSINRVNSLEELEQGTELIDVENNQNSLFVLQEQEIFYILSFISRYLDIVNLSRINKTWNKCCNDKSVKNSCFTSRYGQNNIFIFSKLKIHVQNNNL